MSRLPLLVLVFAVGAACSEGSLPTPPDPRQEPTIASVTVSGPTEPLDVGATAQLTATVRDSDGNTVQGPNLAWSSSDQAVATVSSSGVVTAVGPGDATVEAETGGRRGSVSIEVASPTTEPPLPPPAGTRGAIAYVKDDQLRLIEPDGSNDRLVWALPDTTYRISGVSWRPDGGEIAFSSDHEMAYSLYERDVYAIRPDGTGLRKLTNAPQHAELEGRPRGSVTVRVQNHTFDAGPYFVYVTGAEEPQLVTVPGAGSVRVTFSGVADLGAGVGQHAVVISGINRWWDAAAQADVRPGATVDAGTITISAFPIEHFGADVPFWRGDGSAVGFIGLPTCLLQRSSATPAYGRNYTELVDADAWGSLCGADWAPTAGMHDQLLVADARDYVSSGVTHIHRVTEGSAGRNAPVVSFDDYVQIVDIRWMPGGGGFLVARHDALTDMDINLYAYDFDSDELTKLTDFEGEFVRSFSVSPDGEYIVFERITGGDPYDLRSLRADLWVMRSDGTAARLLVRDAQLPAW